VIFDQTDSGTYESSMSGNGRLTKQGGGALRLSGSSSFAGGTRVVSGTLAAGHDHAVGLGTVTVEGGVFFVESGVTISNAVTLAGGGYDRAFSAEDTLAYGVDVTSSLEGGTPTTAQILGGSLSVSGTVQTSFGKTSAATNDAARVSDVFSLHGTGSALIVLQLTVPGITADKYLGWLDTNEGSATYGQWVNAVLGNTGGDPPRFVAGAYNPETDYQLGNYGVDPTTGSVWALVNHNSDFAIVPEPTALALLTGGLLLFAAQRRREIR
jgi:autotransporter-associated beta strand protein